MSYQNFIYSKPFISLNFDSIPKFGFTAVQTFGNIKAEILKNVDFLRASSTKYVKFISNTRIFELGSLFVSLNPACIQIAIKFKILISFTLRSEPFFQEISIPEIEIEI